jgi:elongation factor 1-beta
MAKVVITMKILPDSPERNLDEIRKAAEEKIKGEGGSLYKEAIEPIAFGISAAVITFIMDEDKGSEAVLEAVKSIEGTGDVQITDMTRMME